ncbi:MAG: hypothetical protein EPO06_07875 [Burkholderiaceae bacterium]|nr:MAG: hypothetical protein EPO06_07875 [Burkholderiaceae bacterium]
MNADPTTGNFTLDGGETLGSHVTRSDFLSTPIGVMSKVLVKNEPWCSFSIPISDKSISLSVFFNGETLDAIHITVLGTAFGTSWNDWSEEKERARKIANDQWLISKGLTPGERYLWGFVWSGTDPKGGLSCAVVRYGTERVER